MCPHSNTIIVSLVIKLVTISVGQNTTVDSKFRILAPEFICPKDVDAVVDKPDNTVITLQVAPEADLRMEWTVRWSALTPAPAQRSTLMLWRTVRELEKQLNKPPPEPYVYVIDNSELLTGVNYTFSVVSIESNGEISEPKSFHIDNTQGDQKLMIEGRNDMLSVILVGAQQAYVDAVFVVEAEITTCKSTQEYYFAWTVQSLESNDSVNVSQVQGSRLEVPPCTLKVGFIYNVNCQVMRYNTGDLITQTSLPIAVQHRGLEVYLNIDQLLITKDTPFTIKSLVISHDYCESAPMTFEWDCSHKGESCNARIIMDYEISFPTGLTNEGEYFINVTVKVANQTGTANATLFVIDPMLPVIELDPLSRIINEDSVVSVVANATNLTPSCTVSWYFATEEYLASSNLGTNNETCEECEHGELLSETVTIHSLEEQFLSELADFSNETEWRQVTASFVASAGRPRARFVCSCGCSLAFNCHTRGSVHADLWFRINAKPKPRDVSVSPETGTALETVFRLSTLAAVDEDTPLQYTFYCGMGNDTILLGSNVEHRALETFLPYHRGGIEVWVKVCDVLGACAKSHSKEMTLDPGQGRTIDTMIDNARAHARRCELPQLMRVVQSAVITYTNTRKEDLLTEFYQSLQKSLSRMDKNGCVTKYYGQYSEMLLWLADHGVEASNLL